MVERGGNHGPTDDAEIVHQENGPLAADDVGEIAAKDRPKHLANVGNAHHCGSLRRAHVGIFNSELGKEDCAKTNDKPNADACEEADDQNRDLPIIKFVEINRVEHNGKLDYGAYGLTETDREIPRN